MLKRPITFKNFEDEDETQIFYFNLSKTELIEWEVENKEGLIKTIQEIIKSDDRKEIISLFQRIILKAYGKKSEDGTRFIKSDEFREEFKQMPAFDALFMELASKEDAAAIFVQGILPKDLTDGVDLKELTANALGMSQSESTSVKDPPEPPLETLAPTPTT